MTPAWLIGALIAATCIVFGGFYTYRTGYANGMNAIQAQWDAEKAAAAIHAQELQANMDNLRTEKNRELARLNATVRNLSYSLRNRPERQARATVPASAASSAGDAGRGCTGAELYREDAELVVAESERAEIIRITLKKCQDAYRAASGQ